MSHSPFGWQTAFLWCMVVATGLTILFVARHSHCVTSYLRLATVSDLNQYPIGIVVTFGCCCSSLQPAWTLHTLVTSVMCPLILCNARTWVDIYASLSKFVAISYSSLSSPEVAGWSFFNLWLGGSARRAKLSTKRLKTLHNSRNDLSSVKLIGAFDPRIASVVCYAISRRLGQINWPK